MIHYFYHCDYTRIIGPHAVAHDIRVFVIADKYFVLPLRDMALRNIQKVLEDNWNTNALPHAIREIYELDSAYGDVLKPEVMKVILHHKELITKPDKYKGFHAELRGSNDFAADAAIAVTAALRNRSRGSPKAKYKCPVCLKFFVLPDGLSAICCPYSDCQNPSDPAWWEKHQLPCGERIYPHPRPEYSR